MLHMPSFNIGLAAGKTAIALGHPRPDTIADIPGFREILDASDFEAPGKIVLLPSSFVEGFVTAYDHPERRLIA